MDQSIMQWTREAINNIQSYSKDKRRKLEQQRPVDDG